MAITSVPTIVIGRRKFRGTPSTGDLKFANEDLTNETDIDRTPQIIAGE